LISDSLGWIVRQWWLLNIGRQFSWRQIDAPIRFIQWRNFVGVCRGYLNGIRWV